MRAKDAIQSALASTQHMLEWYLSDLSDADLLVRPVPGANHIAWQLGHLIDSEPHLIHMELPDAAYPALPAGFAEQHTKETSTSDSPASTTPSTGTRSPGRMRTRSPTRTSSNGRSSSFPFLTTCAMSGSRSNSFFTACELRVFTISDSHSEKM